MIEQKSILYIGGLLFVLSIIVLLTTNFAVANPENITYPILFDKEGTFTGNSVSDISIGITPINGTLKNLIAVVPNSPGEGQSVTITVLTTPMKADKTLDTLNTVRTPLTCTITGASEICVDDAHSVTVAKGNLITIEVALSGGAQRFTELGGGLGFQVD